MAIVIVDDDPAIRVLIQALAEMEGISVAAEFPGVAAARAWSGWPDVTAAIVDWMMPTDNGGVLLDWLAANHPHVTCVVLTAHPSIIHPHAFAVVDKADVNKALAFVAG